MNLIVSHLQQIQVIFSQIKIDFEFEPRSNVVILISSYIFIIPISINMADTFSMTMWKERGVVEHLLLD